MAVRLLFCLWSHLGLNQGPPDYECFFILLLNLVK